MLPPKVYSAQTTALDAHILTIEVDVNRGLHAFSIVGLPDKAVEESSDRVSAAIKNSGFESPKEKNKKIVVSIAPASLKKEGAHFDVGIALAYLLAVGEITFDPQKKLFLGELSLRGEIRPVKGVLPLVKKAKEEGYKEICLPPENAEEGALIEGITVYAPENLEELISHLTDEERLEEVPHTTLPEPTYDQTVDFADVRGQEAAKRGLMIAAAGGHNIALFGPPGTGKTMLAKAFCGILPPLAFNEALEVNGIHSVAGILRGLSVLPPFRSPHHTSSYVSMVGGGTYPKPGEITLAHRGVLFLDEFPEFERRVLEGLRQPLEDREITVTRAKGTARFPADIVLFAAMNPCPCGYQGSSQECKCSAHELERYKKKISGPIVDRIDLWIKVGEVEHELLAKKSKERIGAAVRKQIGAARSRQQKRFSESGKLTLNAHMGTRDLETHVPLQDDVQNLLTSSAAKLKLSPRSYYRVMKVARTIADLEESEIVEKEHLLEALQYRPQNA